MDGLVKVRTKYRNRCIACRLEIEPGTTAIFNRLTRNFRHQGCAHNETIHPPHHAHPKPRERIYGLPMHPPKT